MSSTYMATPSSSPVAPVTTSSTELPSNVSTGFTFNDFHVPFRLFQAVSGCLIHAISFCIFLRTARRVFKSYGISLLLKAFMVVWIIEDVVALPYVYILVQWALDKFIDGYADGDSLKFWAVSLERSVSPGLSPMVFFLTLDRCLTLLLGVHYRLLYSRVVFAMSIVCTVLTMTATLTVYLVRKFVGMPDESCSDYPVCYTRPDDWHDVFRVAFGTANFAASLVFFALLRAQNAKRFAMTHDKKARSNGNTMITYALCSELLLNWLPHASCLAYGLISRKNIGGTFGTYSRFVTSIDAIVSALMYRRIKAASSQNGTSAKITPPPQMAKGAQADGACGSNGTVTFVRPVGDKLRRNTHC